MPNTKSIKVTRSGYKIHGMKDWVLVHFDGFGTMDWVNADSTKLYNDNVVCRLNGSVVYDFVNHTQINEWVHGLDANKDLSNFIADARDHAAFFNALADQLESILNFRKKNGWK